MGSELGSLIATLLEKERWTGEITGLDIDPPRRRLRSATFHRVEPRDRRKMVRIVRDFDPHVVVHVAVWEPNARAHPGDAAEWTHSAAIGVLGAAAECPALEHVVVRSGISVYGRRRGAATRPDESVPPDPTAAFGRSLLETEEIGRQAAAAAEVPLTAVRLAPVVGPHVPSPLGRLLRLPVVPVSLLADPAFSVIDDQDAATAVVAAARAGSTDRSTSSRRARSPPSQAVRIGGRVALPLIGPEWRIARLVTSALGAPIPEHIHELLHRGAHGRRRAGRRGARLHAPPVHPRGRPRALRVGDGDPPAPVGGGGVSALSVLRRQAAGANEVDPWGMDPELVGLARALAPLRWSITRRRRRPRAGDGARAPRGQPPAVGGHPAPRRRGHRSAPRAATVRFTGIADIAPLGPALRRVGGVLARPDEVAGLLRDGELPAVWCEARSSRRVGAAPEPFLAAAMATGAPVLPVAVIAPPLVRRVRVEVGPPVAPRRRDRPAGRGRAGRRRARRHPAASSTRRARRPGWSPVGSTGWPSPGPRTGHGSTTRSSGDPARTRC